MASRREPGKPLENARHERFAQGVASGMSATEAYDEAGYSENRGNASVLKAKQIIAERVDELLDLGAQQVVEKICLTKQAILDRLWHEACNARSDGARVLALKTLGQTNVIGLFVVDDQNAKLATPQECARAIAGDDDDLYRRILTRVPMAPSEKQ